ncbi:MAG TPA: efflux RND transporter periplasmic adaptor subunit [Puia sp.]|nr:efflux RND transporter periplasmic adaptor subunit [Puia sp.]
MKNIATIGIVTMVLILASCGASTPSKEDNTSLAAKKTELAKLKEQQAKLNNDIQSLQNKIDKVDTADAIKEKAKLVSIDTVKAERFTHYIDLQGRIDALNVAIVTPRNGTGGQVREVYVKQGDLVKKGQLLLKLDDAALLKNLKQTETQLSYAQDILQRRETLWKQNIGTEVDVITARNNVKVLEDQLAYMREQASMTNVYADMDGVANDVNVRVGEMFTGVVPGTSTPQIRIVNTQNLKVIAQVPENYLGQVKVGTNVVVVFPELNNKTLNVKVTVAGKLIDPNTRSFYIEARIPGDIDFHPNQIALVRIQDYTVPNAIAVPVSSIQNDEKGKYVLVASKEGDNLIARKRSVEAGRLYGDKIEVLSGLKQGDPVVVEGAQGLYDGIPITTTGQ